MSQGPVGPMPGGSPRSESIAPHLRREVIAQRNLRQARQLASRASLRHQQSEAFNPFSADRKTEQKALKERAHEAHLPKERASPQKVTSPGGSAELASRQQDRNPDMPADRLIQMRESIIAKGGSPEEILEEVLHYFPDPTHADDALNYLEQTTEGDLFHNISTARTLLNERLGREVIAGRNIAEEARASSEAGLAPARELRDLYRDITGNPREQNALFEELSSQYGYDRLKEVIAFLMRSLGADLRAEGPSIARGKLYRLITEMRVLQSILGVYTFFLGRDALISRLFGEAGLERPETLDFERLAQEFMRLVEERYPNAYKVLQLARALEIEEEILSQVIVFGQYRDAIRGVAPRIYQSMKHRYELLTAIIEALEELEQELEEEEKEEEEDGTLRDDDS